MKPGIDGIRGPTMNLAYTSLTMRARRAAQLALSTLVVMTGCPADDGDTDTDDTNVTDATDATNATDATDATTQPTTGEEETGGTTTTGAEAIDYKTDIQPIWDGKCVTACHTPGGSAATNGPLLGADVSYANLVGKQSPTVALPLVAPSDVDGSYLWHKLNNTQGDVNGAGLSMPLGSMLPAAELDLIEQWISEGAKP